MKKNAKNALSLRAETVRSLHSASLAEVAGACFYSITCTQQNACNTIDCPDGGMKPYPPK